MNSRREYSRKRIARLSALIQGRSRTSTLRRNSLHDLPPIRERCLGTMQGDLHGSDDSWAVKLAPGYTRSRLVISLRLADSGSPRIAEASFLARSAPSAGSVRFLNFIVSSLSRKSEPASPCAVEIPERA